MPQPLCSAQLSIEGMSASEIEIGTEFCFGVRIEASDKLVGGVVESNVGESVVRQMLLPLEGNTSVCIARFTRRAPDRVGEHLLTVRFPAQVLAGDQFAEIATTVSFRTRPLRSSVAVWGLPSPVLAGRPFSFNAGVKSSGGCPLGGTRIDVLDATGMQRARGKLGSLPWPGSDGLYWTEICVEAPADGITFWSVRFEGDDAQLQHTDSETRFTFIVTPQPQHTVMVNVVDQESDAPVCGAIVLLGGFRTITDAQGNASVAASSGVANLAVWKQGYAVSSRELNVTGNASIQIEIAAVYEAPVDWL